MTATDLTPAPPHAHLADHDPRAWTPECCACQNQSPRGSGRWDQMLVDESCPACLAQRDQDRPYVVVEWAVRHTSGVVERHVPEGMARRAVAKYPDQVLLRRERVVTPDVVGDYREVPTD